MKQDVLRQASEYAKAHRRKKYWYQIVTCLACIVVFCTTYALMLPAITLEQSQCKLTEHTHSELCYTQVTSVTKTELVCTYEQLNVHQHTSDCFGESGELVCGYADFVVHKHDFSCYDENGNLWCTLPEIEAHTHDESCFAFSEGEDTEEGTDTSEPELICGKEEILLHTHTAECFDENGNLICGKTEITEHVHSESCFRDVNIPVDTNELTCEIPESEEHQHGPLCYGIWELTCGMEEHIHSESCSSPSDVPDTDTEQGPDTAELLDELQITEEALLDISNGPAVFIVANSSQTENTSGIQERTAVLFSALSPRTATDLKTYIESSGGSFFFTLLDQNNQLLPTDENGNYLVSPETQYKLTLGISLPRGIAPGTYQYQLPDGLTVNGGSGTFTLNNVEIGTWSVAENGLIIFTFNDSADNYTDVTISATMGVLFSESENPMDFDGKITVIVQKPPEEEKTTELSKWGSQGDGNKDKPDTGKIYWTIEMLGNAGSNIPGSTITDTIISGNHTYTESDKANGLTFMASQRDPETGEEIEGGWHKWTVAADDPNLTWTDTGWTYTIPNTVTCKYCGTLNLGNENWWYWVEYTSTPNETDITGSLVYQNHITVDGQETDGWATVKHGESSAGIIKNGFFQGSENGGLFQWEVSVTIPGRKSGEQAVYFWYLWDAMRVKDSDGSTIGYITNDMNLSEVEITYNGQTYTVPRLADAGENDLFAWDSTWEDDHGDGIYYGRQIDFFHRCDCTEETCQLWKTYRCDSHEYQKIDEIWVDTGFCRCWTVTEDTVFTFRYETDDPAIIEKYGGSGNLLQNEVSLNHKLKNDDTDSPWKNIEIDNSEALVSIPGLFKKELTQDYNGYVAKYTITVNEAKLQLTEDGLPLTIHDVMTDTLAYISGSLVITTEDSDGNTETLTYGEDYTVTYDGSGTQTDASGNPVHVLDIVILNPDAVQYTLNYDATLIIPAGVTGGIKYSNSASITLFGKTITSGSEEKIYADINISAKNYQVQILKTDVNTGTVLSGAVFGLFNENGGLIASGVTDENGKLLFQTNVTQGIILREHTPYYIQELEAPTGYVCDNTKHWFLFCEESSGCSFESGIEGIQIIPGNQVGTVPITNVHSEYILPETGGIGTSLYTIGGLLLIMAAGILLLYNHKKRGKEDFSSS
ncbi:MAG: SpaA isopeptide-forming pilin-related protein [Oscillospiraceae bacterium]